MNTMRWWIWLGCGLSVWVGISPAAAQPTSTTPVDAPATQPAAESPATTRPAGGIVTLHPGIRIDWTRREVLAEGTVILRQGLLELMVCAPRIREHESIVRMEASPTHLFQALGLIGLEPGAPMRYDIEREQVLPAHGDPIEIAVRYRDPQGLRQERLDRWARLAGGAELPGPITWVFAGSQPLPEAGLAADLEGTVVAVVDFPSALIALPEPRSDRNDELWLEPATERIPPVGTPCILVLSRGPWPVTIDAQGRIRLAGRETLLHALRDRLLASAEEDGPLRVRLSVEPPGSSPNVTLVRHLLSHLGLQETRPGPATASAPTEPAAGISDWAAQRPTDTASAP